jgi:protein-disulfide isomerase
VYRDFAFLSELSVKEAEAAECADDQDKYWEYHDLLWAKGAADVDSLKSHAADLGLDTATFNDCLDTGKQTAEVEKDYQDGQSYGVTGTPAFFINGRLVSGAIPFEDWLDQQGQLQPGFQTIIGEALAAAEASSAVPDVPARSGG